MATDRIKHINQLLAREFGTPFIPRENPEGIADIDTADKEILRRDGSRIGFAFFNLSTTDAMFLRPDVAASTSAGFRVNPAGSVFVNWKEDGDLPAHSWHAVCASNNQAFYLVEYVLP